MFVFVNINEIFCEYVHTLFWLYINNDTIGVFEA